MARGGNLKRRPASKKPGGVVAVLTEGRVTEPEYVRQLAGRLGIAGGAIVLVDVPAVDPATLLKRAKELRADNKRAAKRGQEPLVDQWWILSDTEGPRHPHPKIKETAVAARQAGINIAFSDPCFEYWLLLHYVYTTGGELEAKDMVKRLGEFIPGYSVKSKHPELGDATENLVRALENAERVRVHNVGTGSDSPRTDADLFVRSVAGICGKTQLICGFEPDADRLWPSGY